MSSSERSDPYAFDVGAVMRRPAASDPSRTGRARGIARLGLMLRAMITPSRLEAPLSSPLPDDPAPDVGQPMQRTSPRHAFDDYGAHVPSTPPGEGPDGFTTLLSPSGAVLDDTRRPTGVDGSKDGNPLWENAWWAWSPDVQDRLRAAIARAGAGELVRYGDTALFSRNMLVTVDLTMVPVVTRSGITSIRCSALRADAGPRREPGRHLSSDSTTPSEEG